MEDNKGLTEQKAEAIRLIADSKSFIIITDNGKVTDRRMVITSIGSVLTFLRDMRIMSDGILFPQPSPPPSNLIKQ